MRVAIVASPFIAVPPDKYGGTELFIANLAGALKTKGVDVVVYANGASTVKVEKRWCYRKEDWPPASELDGVIKELHHVSWSMRDAVETCDIVHVNSAPAVTYSQFIQQPVICTLHHPREAELTDLYERYPEVTYAAISRHQASQHPSLRPHAIHHGIDLTKYRLQTGKREYLSFLGRIAPIKGPHTAIAVAQKTGIPLKIAGEIQPIFRDYYETMIKPHVDGRFIEYVGEANLEAKNQLLGGSIGMLFPIQWEEPFGLVMVESMACGTPVFALKGGSVPEVISEGVSGTISHSVEEMVSSVENSAFDPVNVRNWVARMFSVEVMASRYLDLYRRTLNQRAEGRWIGRQVAIAAPKGGAAV